MKKKLSWEEINRKPTTRDNVKEVFSHKIRVAIYNELEHLLSEPVQDINDMIVDCIREILMEEVRNSLSYKGLYFRIRKLANAMIDDAYAEYDKKKESGCNHSN